MKPNEKPPRAEAKIILDTRIYLHMKDTKTNISVPFFLAADYQSLEIVCSYEPKLCDDNMQAKKFILAGIKKYVPEKYHASLGSWKEYASSVVNLVTLSLDSPQGYAGCAHRQKNNDRYIISKDFSSLGFSRINPVAGNWRAVINAHAIVSSEVCYHLQILAYNKEEH